MPRRLTPDVWLFGAAVALLSAGVVMVYSASAIVAADRFHDPYFFLKKQLVWALIGGGVLWVALRCDYRWLEKAVVPALIVANTGDACPGSPPGDAPKIAAALAHAPRKEVVYMQSVAIEGPPCEAMSPHGYLGIEAATVERITQWIGATTGR